MSGHTLELSDVFKLVLLITNCGFLPDNRSLLDRRESTQFLELLLLHSFTLLLCLFCDSILGLIKFYLTEKVKREEVWYIVEYLTCVTDPQQIQEVIDVLLSLCERATKSKMAKRLSGTVCRLKESST